MHATPRTPSTGRRSAARRAGTALTAAVVALSGVAAAGPATAAPNQVDRAPGGGLTRAELARVAQASGDARVAAGIAGRQAQQVARRAAPKRPRPRPPVPLPTTPPALPTAEPTVPTPAPTVEPTAAPTVEPVVTEPTVAPTVEPVVTEPTPAPADPTSPPTAAPPPDGPAVLHVDPAGDDDADGRTPATALRTLDAVNALDLDPGDEVRLKGGATFSGGLLLEAEDAGTAAAPVVIGSYDGRAVLAAGTGSGIVVRNAGGVHVTGLDVVGSGQVGTDLRGDGVLFYTDLDGGVRLPAVAVTDVDVSGFGNVGVEVGAWNASWSGYASVRITDVVAHGNGDAGISTFGFFRPRSRQYSLTDVHVSGSTAHGNLGLAGKRTDSGSGIAIGGVDGGSVRSSEAYGNGSRNDAPKGPAGILVWDSTGVVVADNDVHGNASTTVGGSGIAFVGGVTRSTMTRNVSSGNGGTGYLVLQPGGFRPTTTNVVSRNVSTDDARTGGAGIELAGPADGSGVLDTDVYLNAVSMSPVAGGGLRAAVRISDPVDSALVHDNVLAARRGAALVDVVAGSDRLEFDRNSYTSGAGGFLVVWEGRRFTSLATWRTATGQERTPV